MGHRPRRFGGLGPGPMPEVWPMGMSMSYGIPYVLWHVLRPVSHGPVVCPMALALKILMVLMILILGGS